MHFTTSSFWSLSRVVEYIVAVEEVKSLYITLKLLWMSSWNIIFCYRQFANFCNCSAASIFTPYFITNYSSFSSGSGRYSTSA